MEKVKCVALPGTKEDWDINEQGSGTNNQSADNLSFRIEDLLQDIAYKPLSSVIFSLKRLYF